MTVWEAMDLQDNDISSVKVTLAKMDKSIDTKVLDVFDSRLTDFDATVKDKIESVVSTRLESLDSQIDDKITAEVKDKVDTAVTVQLSPAIEAIVQERVNAALESTTSRLQALEKKLEAQQQTPTDSIVDP